MYDSVSERFVYCESAPLSSIPLEASEIKVPNGAKLRLRHRAEETQWLPLATQNTPVHSLLSLLHPQFYACSQQGLNRYLSNE